MKTLSDLVLTLAGGHQGGGVSSQYLRKTAAQIRDALTPTAVLVLLLLAAPAQAATGYLVPSNPPPVVQLTWDLVPGMSYNLYYGVGSGAYTNKVAIGATNYATVVLASRSSTYFFAATAVANGLESDFSQEVSFRPAQPPSPPTNMRPPVVLSVQWKPAVNDAEWADAGLDWGVWPEAPNGLFRLQIVAVGGPAFVPQGGTTARQGREAE